MLRIEAIYKRWKEECKKDTESNKTAPIRYVIDIQYKKYVSLCYWTMVEPLPFKEWLSEEIGD